MQFFINFIFFHDLFFLIVDILIWFEEVTFSWCPECIFLFFLNRTLGFLLLSLLDTWLSWMKTLLNLLGHYVWPCEVVVASDMWAEVSASVFLREGVRLCFFLLFSGWNAGIAGSRSQDIPKGWQGDSWKKLLRNDFVECPPLPHCLCGGMTFAYLSHCLLQLFLSFHQTQTWLLQCFCFSLFRFLS